MRRVVVGIGYCALAVLGLTGFSGCGGSYPSVARFGESTRTLGGEFGRFTSTAYDLCIQRVNASHTLTFAQGAFSGSAMTAELESCIKSARATPSLVGLGGQLALFGAALEGLAKAGSTDPTDAVAELGGAFKTFVPSASDAQIQAANDLGAKVVQWALSGYAKRNINEAIKESELFVPDTVKLMRVVLDVLGEEIGLYEDKVALLGTHPVFNPPARLPDGATDEQRAAHAQQYATAVARHRELTELQRAALARHKTAASLWRTQLTSLRDVLDEFVAVYRDMVNEAKRDKEEWDLERLVQSAMKLKGLTRALGALPEPRTHEADG
jgi:hypothetical protein